MASGRYVHSRSGYGYVLNVAPDVGQVCDLAGQNAMAEARQLGGPHTDLVCDTQHGYRRWHTRVSTVPSFGSYGSENKWGALRFAIPRI